MEQGRHPVAGRHDVDGLHHELVRVGGDIGTRIHTGELELVRSHLVVLGLGGDAHRPELVVEFAHEARDLFRDGAEIVVLHLLALGGDGTENGAAGEDEVGAFLVELAVDKEILLLRADGGRAALRVSYPKRVEDPQGLLVQRLYGTEQGHFLVQGMPKIGDEGGWDVQRRPRG